VGVLQRFERRLEGLVEGAFARAFKGNVEPVEIAAALEREALDKKAIVGAGRVLVPNAYVVELSREDYARLSPYARQLGVELATMVQESAAEQHWSFVGDVGVTLEQVPEHDTGVFKVRSAVVAPDGGVGVAETRVTPPPARPRRAAAGQPRLIVSKDGSSSSSLERAVPLLTPRTVIGRGHDADLRLSDPGVSRHHAQVELRDGAVWVEDLGSTNGTTLDGVRVTAPVALSHGQRITVGSTVLVFLRDPDGP
jgi:hypothetical protein